MGRGRIKLSGTSAASSNVANLSAKMLVTKRREAGAVARFDLRAAPTAAALKFMWTVGVYWTCTLLLVGNCWPTRPLYWLYMAI